MQAVPLPKRHTRCNDLASRIGLCSYLGVSQMRIAALLVGLSWACCAPLLAQADEPLPYVIGPPIPGLPPNAVIVGEWFHSVSLEGDHALAKLKASNAHDYEIARRIMSAAGELCTADAPKPQIVGLKSEDVVCSAAMYPTNPPQRVVWFKVNHILYRMLVTLPT